MRKFIAVVFFFAIAIIKIEGQSAPTIGDITQPTCDIPTGSVELTGLPEEDWTLTRYPGAIETAGNTTSYIVTSLYPGTYTWTVTTTGDPSPESQPAVVNPQPVTPSAPTIGTIIQPTCTEATGSVVLNGLPDGNWTINPGDIQGSTNSTTISGLTAGTYNYTVTNDEGCTSPESDDIVINAQPTAPPAATVSITQPTCAVGTGIVTITSPTGDYEYNIDGGTYQSSTTFSGVATGSHTILVRRSTDHTCISSPTSANINAQPAPPNAPTVSITQPTCGVATGTITITSPLGAYQYNIDGGTFQSSITFNGVTPGSHNIRVRSSSDLTCISNPTLVTVADQPETPTAPIVGTITQPTCNSATGSVVLNGLPASGSWTITRTPGGNTYTGSGTSITITGLPAGTTYTFTVTNSVGCTSVSSSSVSINTQPVTPSAPTIGTITHPTCSMSTGSVILNGLPATGSWTVTRTPGGNIYTGSGTSTTITGLLSATTYTFTVTNSDGCTSSSSNSVAINTQPPTPSTPVVGTITQPTCTVATGSVVLSGLPSSGTWTVTRLPGGTTNTGSGTSTTITGLTAGTTYTFTVTNSYGCTSSSTGNVVIAIQPVTPSIPTVGTITQPSCDVATGSISLGGLPSSGTWTINRSPGGTTYSGTGTSTIITGLGPDTYNFTVTNADGCTSAATGSIVIYSQPVTPSAPAIGSITQPTCTVATGSVVLNGLPASGTWIITRSPDDETITGTGSSTTISGLPAGTIYTFTVTNADGCTSASTDDVIIDDQPETPAEPIIETVTQPTCTSATGSVVINRLPSTGTWILTRSPDGTTITGSGTTTTISALSAGNYSFSVTNASGCTSASTDNVIIETQPETPDPPVIGSITQPTCTIATGSVTLNGLPATGTWTLLTLQDGTTSTGTGPTAIVSDLVAGTYTFTVTNADGCTSGSSDNVIINVQPPTPDAPTIGNISHPTCTVATGSVILNDLPSTGPWTLTRSPDGILSTGTGETTTISGLPSGTFTFTVTNTFGCVSTSSGNVVINTQPITPSAPVIGNITQPTPAVPTGSVVLTGLPSAGTWTLTMSPGGVNTSGTGPTRTISGLAPGRYTFTVTNASGCTSASSQVVGLYTIELTGPDNTVIRTRDTLMIDDSDEGSFKIGVESNTDWSVTDNSLWLQAVRETGTSNIEVTYMENISVFDKVAAMNVTYTSNPDMLIYVRQKGRVSQLIGSKFENVIMYPNPSGDFVYLKLSDEEHAKITISIANIYGNLIFTREFENTSPHQLIELNLSDLPVGQYFITIGDEVSHRTFRLIKF